MTFDRREPSFTAPEPSVAACPLCRDLGPHESVFGADDRAYRLCGNCRLIFVDRSDHLSRESAEAHYRTHENSIDNEGYVAFLRRAIDPLLPYLSPEMRGLDFGSGPGPTLSLILRRQGLDCSDYDPLFADTPLQPPYDFLFATECFEHFADPWKDIAKIEALLRPGGFLSVMTERWTDLNAFRTWYYTRDPTHVSFFHEETFHFICRRFGFRRLPCNDRRVLLLQRIPE